MSRERISQIIRTGSVLVAAVTPFVATASYVHKYTIDDGTYANQFGVTVWENEGQNSVNFTVIGGSIVVQKTVAGSAEPCPWSSKFTPLGQSDSDTHIVPAETIFGVPPGSGSQVNDDATENGSVGNPPVSAEFVRVTYWKEVASHDVFKAVERWE